MWKLNDSMSISSGVDLPTEVLFLEVTNMRDVEEHCGKRRKLTGNKLTF